MPGGEASAPNRSLPTLDRLNAQVPANVDACAVAKDWLLQFGQRIEESDAIRAAALLADDVWWRDMIALTWEFRTFEGNEATKRFLTDQLPVVKFSKLALTPETAGFQQVFPDLAWIQAMFSFETEVGFGTGTFRLIPTTPSASPSSADGWKAHSVYTTLEGLKGFPERTGPNRNAIPDHGMWAEKRRKEVEFTERDSSVVIIGGGQSGLGVAARLQLLGVPTLIVEKHARVGDQWRGRYEALCLHDPVWYDHMPYIPFPSSWPVWSPAPKLADWLESYAQNMELNVWTSTTVEKLVQNPSQDGWSVIVKRGDGSTRTVKAGHVVSATGFSGKPKMPSYTGMDEFEGKIIHSSQYKSARENKGKKVVIIGACTSSHDIAQDHYTHGVDVTMFQRSSTCVMSTKEGIPRLMGGLYEEGGPPTELADLFGASFPNYLTKLLQTRVFKDITGADTELLEGLHRAGFRTNKGPDDSGFMMMVYERSGGYYLDVGCSQLIIDGKVKLKSGTQISHFNKNCIVFEDGSELPADVVICATGYGPAKEYVGQLINSEAAENLGPVWGLNEEGEVNGVWRWCGIPRLYFTIGNLAMCRFHSKHLALQIKAIEEGIHGPRYTK